VNQNFNDYKVCAGMAETHDCTLYPGNSPCLPIILPTAGISI
jgi:hypothetical protein